MAEQTLHAPTTIQAKQSTYAWMKKSVQENASLYYDQYKKAVSGMESLEHDIMLSQKNLKALEEEYSAILKEQNAIKIEQMLRHDTTPKQKMKSLIRAFITRLTDGR